MRGPLRGRAVPAAVAVLAGLSIATGGLAACSGGLVRHDAHGGRAGGLITADDPRAARAYLAALDAAVSRLSAEERKIPANPATPSALARSIHLLAEVVGRFGASVAAAAPPARVAGDHARLVARATAYRSELGRIAADAIRPYKLSSAGRRLIIATSRASAELSTALTAIHRRLGAG